MPRHRHRSHTGQHVAAAVIGTAVLFSLTGSTATGTPATGTTVAPIAAPATPGPATTPRSAGDPHAAAPTAGTGAGTTARWRARTGDGPAGFWYGTDSFPVKLTGHGRATMPVTGGAYGGYIGMAGSWAAWQGCGTRIAWSAANARAAISNYATYHQGIGTGVYWFMGGPGVDPRYNGTAAEAYAWGQQQAKRALSDISHRRITYPVIFMDIELPGNAPTMTPAPDNGWNSVYTAPCSGRVSSASIPPSVDRADFNGFSAYITSHSRYAPGVYSSRAIWAGIFGSGATASIRHTYEWTYNPATASLARPPSGWCLTGTRVCAQFFGGVRRTDPEALMWQWSGGGGTYNGYGDFDQIDAHRTP